MSVLPPKYFTPEEYLTLEREAAYKSEYYQGEIFPMGELWGDTPEAMAGASLAYNTITENISGFLFEAVRKRRGCRGFSKDQRIYTPATGFYTYPDYLVLCGPPQFSDAHNDTILNPVLIIEVLSKRTANYDRGAKFGFYRSIHSMCEYAVIDSRALYAEHLKLVNNHWQLAGEWRSKSGAMYFDSIDATLSLLDVYDGNDTLMFAGSVSEDAEPYGLPA